MNKTMLVLLLSVLLSACAQTTPELAAPDPVVCQANWNELAPPGDGASAAHQIINEVQLPNTVGELAKKCLLAGWRWAEPTAVYRPSYCAVILKIGTTQFQVLTKDQGAVWLPAPDGVRAWAEQGDYVTLEKSSHQDDSWEITTSRCKP